MSSGRSQSLYVFIRRVIKKIVVTIAAYDSLSTTYKILSNIISVKVNSICRENYWGSSVLVST